MTVVLDIEIKLCVKITPSRNLIETLSFEEQSYIHAQFTFQLVERGRERGRESRELSDLSATQTFQSLSSLFKTDINYSKNTENEINVIFMNLYRSQTLF